MGGLIAKLLYRIHRYTRIFDGKRVKIMGPLRSGSNLLEKSLYGSTNIIVPTSTRPCWKHDYLTKLDRNIPSIIVIREPIEWSVSFYNWECIHGRSTREIGIVKFLDSVSNQPEIFSRYGNITPKEYWSGFVSSALQEADTRENVILVAYDRLLVNPEKHLEYISDKIGLKVRNKLALCDFKADWWTPPNVELPFSKFEKREFQMEAKATITKDLERQWSDFLNEALE